MGPSSPRAICEHCSLPSAEGKKCCWLVYSEIKKYKRHVLNNYIIEVIFDMIVSIISVILDIITFVVYISKGKYALAFLTAIPILLPTTVFTNVYMSDERRGYCKMPKNRRKGMMLTKVNTAGESPLSNMEERVQQGSKLGILNLAACCSGCWHSIFHRDRRIRERGLKLMRKTVRRSLKYIFGTLVLRFIAWAWYPKALLFGMRALKEPKKYMRMEQPDVHWSRELLIRLDFLQAALENAPQCVIQLFTLLTDFTEDTVLGLMTLSFSFIDFIRVVTNVFWNLHKGPVLAPKKCYGSLIWRLVNLGSWIFLYVARSCAIALLIGSIASKGYESVVIVPILVWIGHCTLLAKVISTRIAKSAIDKLKLGVTMIITIFFLPELDTREARLIVQVYSAMTLLENTLFIIPYKGIDYTGYCFQSLSSWSKNMTILQGKGHGLGTFGGPSPWLMGRSSSTTTGDGSQDCLIDPIVVVLMVPCLTIVGFTARMAANHRMLRFNDQRLEKESKPMEMEMEERIATIYNKRWTNMNVKEMWNNFLTMITHKDIDPKEQDEVILGVADLTNSFRSSQEFIRKSCYTICADERGSTSELSEEPIRGQGPISAVNLDVDIDYSILKVISKRDSLGDVADSSPLKRQSLPRFKNISRSQLPTFVFEDPQHDFRQTLDVRYLKINTPTGVHIFESCNI